MAFDRRVLALAPALICLAHAAVAAPTPVVVTGDPVAPPFDTPGQGLCAAMSVSNNPAGDFPQSTALYNAGINSFMEANAGSRVTRSIRTVFDLSNNNTSTPQKYSYGDFTDAQLPTCLTGGCDFVGLTSGDTTTSFATRFRGYINITSTLVGKALHFGFFTDDAVSFTLYDKSQTAYPVVTRPPQLGSATWRTTNSVTFTKAGLYAVEILYAQISGDAALEMSIFDGPFTDFELPANQAGTVSLRASGFALLPSDLFFQAENGSQTFSDPDQCVQCNRQFANSPGNGGCGAGYYCNTAALCAPCNSSLYCGPSCSPCGQATPVCINLNGTNTCVQCAKDTDCGIQHCDQKTHTCKECNVDADCPQGKVCDADAHECKECNDDSQCMRGLTCSNHACVPCNSKDHCAGASCNCCPGGDNIKCAPLSAGAAPTCVECVKDTDCAAGKKCDTVNGRCVDQVAECNTPDRCGASCVRCPQDRPYCLDGQVCVECRNDLECAQGSFCVSGECTPCVTDRHCGARCGTCSGDTPFCLSDGTVEHAVCGRCRSDADCAGGTCNPDTHTCSAGCAETCAEGTVCDGQKCVQCYASAHCLCGGSCDPATNTCVSACNDSSDCGANQHCSLIDKTCQEGRRKPDTAPRGGGLCCGIAGPPTAGGILLAILTLAFLSRRRAR